MSEKHILLTDSDATTAEELRLALGPDWTVESVTTGAAALQKLRTGRIEILMTSLQLPDMTPAQLLNRVRNKHPKTLRFVLATEHERRRMVKEVLGAHQFLTRPFEAQSLRSSLCSGAGFW